MRRLDDKLVTSLASERLQMPGMSPIRVDYIVLASIFSRYVLEKLHPRIIYQSSFSLKEGGMKEEFDNYLNSKI